jgi:hypothetical protein
LSRLAIQDLFGIVGERIKAFVELDIAVIQMTIGIIRGTQCGADIPGASKDVGVLVYQLPHVTHRSLIWDEINSTVEGSVGRLARVQNAY